MRHILNIKGIIALGVMVVVLAVGATYAANMVFDKVVPAKWTTVLTTGDEPIDVYEADGTTLLTQIDFGTTKIDSFGKVQIPTHKVVIKNLSSRVLEVVVTGDWADDIIPVFGLTTGELKEAPGNGFKLQPKGQTGDTVAGWVGLTLRKPSAGTKNTTIIFRAVSGYYPD